MFNVENDPYLDLLEQLGVLYADDETRIKALDQAGYKEIKGPDGLLTVIRKGEQPLIPEDHKFASLLTGLKAPIKQGLKVLFNPASAKTTTGAVLATGLDAAGVYSGGRGLNNTIGKWMSGEFHHSDLPETVLNFMAMVPGLRATVSTLPYVSRTVQGVAQGANQALTNATKYAVDNGIVGVSELPTSLVSRATQTPKLTGEPLLNVGWAPKQTIDVRRAGDLTEMFYPQRYDAALEGANPFGVWLQGKFGIPRTNFTNPGKGDKAFRARELFRERPQYSGTVTFDKPIQTIGEVPNRAALSYGAEKMGADGIIYNSVYDNGFNNNQVLFSFKRPNLEIADIDVLPKYPFIKKPSVMDEVRAAIKPSASQLKFADDATKGAIFARTTAPQITIDPLKLKDYTPEVLNIISHGWMPGYGNPSWFKLEGIPGRKFLGEGFENAVFSGDADDVLKFSLQRNIERHPNFQDVFTTRDIHFTSLEDMVAGASKRLAEANKYWFAEPQNLVGYYNSIGNNGELLYFPVYSQTTMKSGIPTPKVRDVQPFVSKDAKLMDMGDSYRGFPVRKGTIRILNGPKRTKWVPDPIVGQNATKRFLFSQHPQYKYLSEDIYKNNIFSENDLPIPLDSHHGNFMYGQDGVLRATDLLKEGGKINE